MILNDVAEEQAEAGGDVNVVAGSELKEMWRTAAIVFAIEAIELNLAFRLILQGDFWDVGYSEDTPIKDTIKATLKFWVEVAIFPLDIFGVYCS